MALVRGIPFEKLPRVKQHAIFVAQRKQRATPAENLFRAYLAKQGLSYRFQHGFYNPFYRIVDFYLPEHRLGIEIDGPSHTDPEHDRRMDEWFERARGVKILRFSNDQVYRGDFGPVHDFVQRNRRRCAAGEKCV